MKFVCDRCQTRYSIADEKVRQKILRIRCKTCGNVIVVQDEHARASGGDVAARGADATEHFESAKTDASSSPKTVPSSAPKAVASSRPKAIPSSASKAAPAGLSKTGSASAYKAPLSSGLRGASAAPKAGPGGPPPPPPAAAVEHDPLGGRVEWYLAVGGVRSGPFSRVEAAQKVLTAAPGKTVHVWKEGMPGWKPSDEVSVIARELSLLRPPPPPPPEPRKTPMPMTSSPPKVAAMPNAGAKAAKAHEPQSLFPGKPLTPEPASMSDSMDFAADTNPGAFSDITTKKAKTIQDLANEPGEGSFADVTTKKNKNLRELETEPLFATAPAFSEAERTPAPVHPLPPVHPPSPVAAKAVEPPHPSSSSSKLPAAVRVSQTNLPIAALPHPFKASAASTPSPLAAPAAAPPKPFVAPAALAPIPPTSTAAPAPSGPPRAATSSTAMPAASVVVPAQSDLGGFSEVIRAVAESDSPASSSQALPAPLTPLDYSTFPPQISPELQAPMGLARPGLKYVVAACVIVALVILIVMVTLRMDSRKVPEPGPAPVRASEPVAADPPKPVAVESAKPAPVLEEKQDVGTRGSGKHGAAKPGRHMDVGPAPEHQPVSKQPAKAELVARPNPFDELKEVSQSQISSVVRNKTNQAALKSCYERALKMDNHLTSGRIDVTVSVGTSGVVQRVVVNAPASFILVEPCIKSAVKRWVFPPSPEEYGTNFPLIMQGGM
jgi:predicted Zn finger-like uncharacterized protein